MADLIIVNLYGGILPVEGEPVVRKGFRGFLDRHSSRKIAISSYETSDRVERDLEATGLLGRVDRVYTSENMGYAPLQGTETPLIKPWARADFGTNEKRTLYISNDPRDIDAASWYDAQAIQIPTFEGRDDDFSFDAISADSLLLRATYFIQRMRERPRRIVLE